MIKIVENCQLEIDEDRGVLYVHSPEGITLVRVCQIPEQTIHSPMIDVVFDRELAKPLNRKPAHYPVGLAGPATRTDFRALERNSASEMGETT